MRVEGLTWRTGYPADPRPAVLFAGDWYHPGRVPARAVGGLAGCLHAFQSEGCKGASRIYLENSLDTEL